MTDFQPFNEIRLFFTAGSFRAVNPVFVTTLPFIFLCRLFPKTANIFAGETPNSPLIAYPDVQKTEFLLILAWADCQTGHMLMGAALPK